MRSMSKANVANSPADVCETYGLRARRMHREALTVATLNGVFAEFAVAGLADYCGVSRE